MSIEFDSGSGLNQKALRRVLGYAEESMNKCVSKNGLSIIVEWVDRRFHFIPGNPFTYRMWLAEAKKNVCRMN